MRYRRLLRLGAAALATATLTACGASDTAASSDTVTVWIMRDTMSEQLVQDFRATYEAEHAGTKLAIQIQEWDGIGQKVVGALASNDAPDVIEVGNTQVAQYVSSGGVTDLTGKTQELNGADWLPGLRDPGNVDGKQFGIPFYGASRVVIYHKELFSAAGITAPPATRAEWLDVTGKLNKGGTQGIYLPGQNWYVLSGFVWDEGGDLASTDGTTWRGGLSTPQGLAAIDFYRQLQALGKGPKDSDEAKPQQTDVFSRGDIAQVIASPGTAELIVKANPALKDKLGFFPIPGKTAGQPGAVLTGGSNLIIPAASANQEKAYEVLKALASEPFQGKFASTMGYSPNRTSLMSQGNSNEGLAAMAKGAVNGHATPKSPNWAAVEAKNPIKEFMTTVLIGGDPAVSARQADDLIAHALNTAK